MSKDAVDRIDPILVGARARSQGDAIDTTPKREGRTDLDARAEQGYLHCGPVGSGHFVKMIHNGIEYGLMQAYAEGFDILANKNVDEAARCRTLRPQPRRHRRGVAAGQRRRVVAARPDVDRARGRCDACRRFTGEVADSGEGRWTLDAAIEEEVPVNVLSASLYARFRSRRDHTVADKLLSAMRNQFGGHVEGKKQVKAAKKSSHRRRRDRSAGRR